MLLLFPFYRWENKGSKMLTDSSKVLELLGRDLVLGQVLNPGLVV